MSRADIVDVDAEVMSRGSVVLLRPWTPAAEDWIAENVQEEAQWFGPNLVVEPRYLDNLIDGMRDAGLIVV